MRPLLSLVLVGASLSSVGCANTGQKYARDQASARTCDWYARCEQVGEGKRYPDRDECLLENQNLWNSLWPSEECDGKVDPQALDFCLKGIDATECGNGLDALNTALNKCAKDKVCGN